MTEDGAQDDDLRYNEMVEGAFRSVVREAIARVVATGALPGKHHFYITFLTDFPGVQIPGYLRERYPGEMTIVLQYQFEDLMVDETKMAVTLSFNNKPERLVVPLRAISIFADPSVNFALQFQPTGDGAADGDGVLPMPAAGGSEGEGGGVAPPTGTDGPGSGGGQVVRLDSFRKKD